MDEEVGRDGGSLLAGLCTPVQAVSILSYPVQQPTHTDLTRPCRSRKNLNGVSYTLHFMNVIIKVCLYRQTFTTFDANYINIGN